MNSYTVEIGNLSVRVVCGKFSHAIMQGESHIADLCVASSGWAAYDENQHLMTTQPTVFDVLRYIQENR